MLSGTFLANRWSNSHGLIHLLSGHPFTTFQEFLRVFASDRQGYWGDPELRRQLRLVTFLMAFIFARPSSLLELPGLHVHDVPFDISDEEVYHAVHFTKRFFDALRRQNSGSGGIQVLSLLLDDNKR